MRMQVNRKVGHLQFIHFLKNCFSPPSVILSAAKDLSLGRAQILRCAQDDSRAEVNTPGAGPSHGQAPP